RRAAARRRVRSGRALYPPDMGAAPRRATQGTAPSEIRAAGAGGGQGPKDARLRSRRAHRRPSRAALHRARVGPASRRGHGRRHQQAGSGNRGGRSAVEPAAMSEAETRAGFVAVIGAPNAGKSTLVNALVGQKVAIVSAKAQTTRSRLMGIAIHGEAQILLVDTPGIFEPRRRLDRAMVAAAWTGAQDADLIL